VDSYKKMLNRFSTVFDYDLKTFNDEKLLALSDDIYSFYREEVSMPGFSDGFMFYAEKRLNDLIVEYCDLNKLNNFTEIFIYGAMGAIFVPILNLFSVSLLLIFISIYDFI